MSKKVNWLSTIKFILKYCNLERVWLNPNSISTGKLARQCKKVLQDKFIKFFKDKLSNPISSNATYNTMNNQVSTISRGGNKLRTYNSIKLGFSIEPYLLIIKDKEVRRSISKLRCGNHDLMIETGRYKKQPVEERLCSKCSCVEDEVHFLTECELSSITREKLVKDIRLIDPNFTTDHRLQMFFSLMTTDNCFTAKRLAKFLNAIFEIRRICYETIYRGR